MTEVAVSWELFEQATKAATSRAMQTNARMAAPYERSQGCI